MSILDRNPSLLADVMQAADQFAETLASRAELDALDRVELAQRVEDRAWAYLMARDAEGAT